MEPGLESDAALPATPEQLLRVAFASSCGLLLLGELLAHRLMLLVVGRGLGAPRPLLALTSSLVVNITLSDRLFLACVVPVLLLSFLRRDRWLDPAVCTTSQAANTATMICTSYSMAATALLCHVAVARPDAVLPASRGSWLLLCGAMWDLAGPVLKYPTILKTCYHQILQENELRLSQTRSLPQSNEGPSEGQDPCP